MRLFGLKLCASMFIVVLTVLSLVPSVFADGTYNVNINNTAVGGGWFSGNNRYWDYTKDYLDQERVVTDQNGHKVMLLPSGRNHVTLYITNLPYYETICYAAYTNWVSPTNWLIHTCADGTSATFTFCVPDGNYEAEFQAYNLGYGVDTIPHTVQIVSDYVGMCGNPSP